MLEVLGIILAVVGIGVGIYYGRKSLKGQKVLPPKPSKSPSPPLVPNLPELYFAHPYPMQPNFTGRNRERKELTDWFTRGNQPIFAYIAIGGTGKSALCWYWLQEDVIKKGLAHQGIIWWSFYEREARFESFLSKAIQ